MLELTGYKYLKLMFMYIICEKDERSRIALESLAQSIPINRKKQLKSELGGGKTQF